MLIDRDVTRADLRKLIKASLSTIAAMGKVKVRGFIPKEWNVSVLHLIANQEI